MPMNELLTSAVASTIRYRRLSGMEFRGARTPSARLGPDRERVGDWTLRVLAAGRSRWVVARSLPVIGSGWSRSMTKGGDYVAEGDRSPGEAVSRPSRCLCCAGLCRDVRQGRGYGGPKLGMSVTTAAPSTAHVASSTRATADMRDAVPQPPVRPGQRQSSSSLFPPQTRTTNEERD